MGPLHEDKAHYLKKAVSDLKLNTSMATIGAIGHEGNQAQLAGIAYKASGRSFMSIQHSKMTL